MSTAAPSPGGGPDLCKGISVTGCIHTEQHGTFHHCALSLQINVRARAQLSAKIAETPVGVHNA